MRNFSFSHNVFKRLVSQGRQKVSLCGNGLKINCTIWATIKLSSTNAFNLDKAKILSSYKKLTRYQVEQNFTFQPIHNCRQQAWDWSPQENIGKWKPNLEVRHFEGSIPQLWRALLKGGSFYTQYSCIFFNRKRKSDNFLIWSAWITRSTSTFQKIGNPPKIWKISCLRQKKI